LQKNDSPVLRSIVRQGVGLFYLLVLALVAAPPAWALDKVTLQLEWHLQFEYAGFVAAQHKGFYRDVGLDVEILEYQPGQDVIEQVLAGEVEFGIHNAALVLHDNEVAPVVMLATYLQRSPLVLVTRPDIDGPADLLGERIMGTTNEFRYSSLALMLNHFYVNKSNSHFVEHTFSVDDFVDGKVAAMSAFLSNQLYELDRRNVPYKVLDPADYGFYASAVNLYTSRGQALQHPERTRRFVEASNRGWQYALQHPEEVIELIYAEYTQRKSREALAFEAGITREMMLLDFAPIGATSEELTRRTFKQMQRSGLLPAGAGYEQLTFEELQEQMHTPFALGAEEKAYLQRKGKLVVCVDPDWMPFERLQDGRHTGIAADVFDIFRSQLSIPIEVYQANTWAEVVAAAQARQCDLYSLAAETPERLRYMDFTDPYIDLPVVLATDADELFIENLAEVIDRPIGVVEGYALVELLRARHPSINLVEVESISDGLHRVESGELYGYIDNLMVIAHKIQQHFTGTLKISGRLNERVLLAVGTRNDEPLLRNIFQHLVEDLNENPEWKQRIYNTWVSVREDTGYDYQLIGKILAVAAVVALAVLWHILQLRRYNRKLEFLSSTDPLTGLSNRHRITELLNEQQYRLERYGEPCGVLMLDVDNFKQINDRFGHHMGDQVLRAFGTLIRQNVRAADVAGRWGGEEFLILCPETGKAGTAALAEKLLATVRTADFPHREAMTASIGVGELASGSEIHRQLEQIDFALYEAKRSGRDQVVCVPVPAAPNERLSPARSARGM
jgi:diguanylate cyclase (GGDEF)-like protein